MNMMSKGLRWGIPGGGPSFVVPDLWNPGSVHDARLSPESRAILAEIATVVRFRKGETIFREGESAASVFNIITGMVKSYKLLSDGKPHIIGFRFADDLIGLPKNGRYVNTAEALSAVTLYRMPATAIEARLRQHAGLDFQVIGKLCQAVRDSQDHALLLSERRATTKLGLFLQMLEARQGLRGACTGEVFLPMSRSDIGSYTGISAEAVTRALRELSDRGAIKFRDRRHLQITDRARLQIGVPERGDIKG